MEPAERRQSRICLLSVGYGRNLYLLPASIQTENEAVHLRKKRSYHLYFLSESTKHLNSKQINIVTF